MKAELLASGKCFGCGESGHLSQNCPTGNVVKFVGNKPPGVPSYSMEMDLLEEDSRDVKLLSSMPVGMILFTDAQMSNTIFNLNDWCSTYPIWQRPDIAARRYIGDCYALTAEYQLTLQQPYPGDDSWANSEVMPDDRFKVARSRKYPELFYITDKLTNFKIPISIKYLSNPKFNLSQWYAKWRVKALGLDESV